MSRVRRDHPRCRSAMWICLCGHTPDMVIYSKFHRNPFRGLGAPGGRNFPITITLVIGFYNRLHYRASRDNFYGATMTFKGRLLLAPLMLKLFFGQKFLSTV